MLEVVIATMRKRAVILSSIVLALFLLGSSQALGGFQSAPVDRKGSIRPTAVLDPSFGGDGLVTLPGEANGLAVHGAVTLSGDVIASGGLALRGLTSSGDPAPSFGAVGTVSPPPPEGGEFSLSDFTLDSEGRLLVIGTSRFPEVQYGYPQRSTSSTVRILRFLPNGLPDPSFGQAGVVETDFGQPPPHDKQGRALQPNASTEATGIAIDPQGQIAVTGSAYIRLSDRSCGLEVPYPVAVSAAFVARLTEDGALDSSFGGDGIVGGRKLDELPLRAKSVGEPVIGPHGEITYRSIAINACPQDRGRWGVAQLAPDGRTRRTLGRKGAVGGYFTALAGERDGSVVALARIGRNEGEAFRARLIRIGADGEVHRAFGHHGHTIVKLGIPWGNATDSLAVDAQGRILVGGTLVTNMRRRAPNGKLAGRNRRSILIMRLSVDGREEMNFGPNGRVATSFPGLVGFGPSDLLLDTEGRVVTVHRYVDRGKAGEVSGLVLARYLLRN